MFRRIAFFWFVLLPALILGSDSIKLPAPPPTEKIPVSEVLHGVTITDPYRWLEDQNSPATRKWIAEQNAYTQSLLDQIPGSDAIVARMTELFRVDTIGVPGERNHRLFYTARKAGQEQSVMYMRDAGGRDQVLEDGNTLSADHTISVSFNGLTRDGSLIGYGIRRGGADEVEIHFKDTNALADLKDVMPTGRYTGLSFLPDKSGFYYEIHLKDGPHVRFHKMGNDAAGDQEIWSVKDPSMGAAAQVTDDGRFLLMSVFYGTASDHNDLWLQDLANHGELKPLINDIHAGFQVALAGDTAYVHTNWKAENGRIIAIDLNNPARDKWRDIVPEATDAISGFAPAGGKLVVQYLHNATSVLKIFSGDGRPLGEVKLPGLGTVGGLSARWENNNLYYGFVSFAQPLTIYRYDMGKGTQQEWARNSVPVDPTKFETRQIWYESKDKTQIPMFLFYKKGLKLDGNLPVWLTGYGGFNLSSTPSFVARAIYWAERGGVYAVANLRGGGEFGEKWHHAGMFEKKQNVFDDFTAAAQWLIANHYTNPQRLAIFGGSNGGLLVGAALTQHPELFKAVICEYPLLDMIRYQQFLVARYWVVEYGSSENPDQFKYIYAYSPYHNVKPGTKYPAVLLWSGDSDTRVAPLHARKMTALLQAANGGPNPILLHYDAASGHSRGAETATTKRIEEERDRFLFVFWQLGMTAAPAKTAAAANK
jgi:prolyl oligopeptidase